MFFLLRDPLLSASQSLPAAPTTHLLPSPTRLPFGVCKMPSKGQDIFIEYIESPTNFDCVQQVVLEETEWSLALQAARVPVGAVLRTRLASYPRRWAHQAKYITGLVKPTHNQFSEELKCPLESWQAKACSVNGRPKNTPLGIQSAWHNH